MGWLNDMLGRLGTPSPAPAVPPAVPPAAPVKPPSPASLVTPAGDTYDTYLKLLTAREGLRLVVYRDSLGKLTVGVGHLVLPEDNLKLGDKITQAQSDAFLAKDSLGAYGAALAQMKQAGITDMRFAPWLGSVNFQLGTGWTKKFPNTWKMIVAGNYATAATAVADSAWASQTPVRVRDFQAALRALPQKP